HIPTSMPNPPRRIRANRDTATNAATAPRWSRRNIRNFRRTRRRRDRPLSVQHKLMARVISMWSPSPCAPSARGLVPWGPEPLIITVPPARPFGFPFIIRRKEIRDRRFERRCDMEQPAGRDTAEAAFVFVRLLKRDADDLG